MSAHLLVGATTVPIYAVPESAASELREMGVSVPDVNMWHWPMGLGQHGRGRFVVMAKDLADLDDPEWYEVTLVLGDIRFDALSLIRRGIFFPSAGSPPMLVVDVVDERYRWFGAINHSTMNLTGQRPEVDEPETIRQFAQRVVSSDDFHYFLSGEIAWPSEETGAVVAYDVRLSAAPVGVSLDRLLAYAGLRVCPLPSLAYEDRAPLPPGYGPSSPLEHRYEVRPLAESGIGLAATYSGLKDTTLWASIGATAYTAALTGGGEGIVQAGFPIVTNFNQLPEAVEVAFPAIREDGYPRAAPWDRDESIRVRVEIPGGLGPVTRIGAAIYATLSGDNPASVTNQEALDAEAQRLADLVAAVHRVGTPNIVVGGFAPVRMVSAIDEVIYGIDPPTTRIVSDVRRSLRTSPLRVVDATGLALAYEGPITTQIRAVGPPPDVFVGVITARNTESLTYDAAAINNPGIAVADKAPINRPVNLTAVDVIPASVGDFCLLLRVSSESVALVAYERISTASCDEPPIQGAAIQGVRPESFTAQVLGI